jgi:hypothetical protein
MKVASKTHFVREADRHAMSVRREVLEKIFETKIAARKSGAIVAPM